MMISDHTKAPKQLRLPAGKPFSLTYDMAIGRIGDLLTNIHLHAFRAGRPSSGRICRVRNCVWGVHQKYRQTFTNSPTLKASVG
jgi:hypothetical protein